MILLTCICLCFGVVSIPHFLCEINCACVTVSSYDIRVSYCRCKRDRDDKHEQNALWLGDYRSAVHCLS
jgi:hypothetical protein